MDQLSKCHDAPCKPPQWPVPYARHAAIERLLGIETLDGSKADPPCPLIYRASSYHGLLLCAGQITIGCKASNTISTVYAVRHQPPSAQNRLLGTNHPQHQIPTALCVCVLDHVAITFSCFHFCRRVHALQATLLVRQLVQFFS